jgi:hypothetical protein
MAFNLHITQIMAKPDHDDYSADLYTGDARNQTVTFVLEYNDRQGNSGFAPEVSNQKSAPVNQERKYPIRIFTIQADA